MPFVTRLTFQSGDQRVLERVVGDIKERAARKGVELRGPNPEPLEEHRVPQYKLLTPNARRASSAERSESDGGEFEPWRYTVYTRTMSIVGYDDFARRVAGEAYPESVHVTAEVTQVKSGSR